MRRLRLLALALALGAAAGCATPRPAPLDAQTATLRAQALASVREQPALTAIYRPDLDSTLFHSRPMLLDASVGEDGAQLAFVVAAAWFAGTRGAAAGPGRPLLLFYRETQTGRVRLASSHVPRVEVDDRDVPVGPVGYMVEVEQQAPDGPLGEALYAYVPRGTLERMARASVVEGELGKLDFELRRRDLDPVRLFLAALAERGLATADAADGD